MAVLWYGHFDSTAEDKRLLTADDLARRNRAMMTNGLKNGGTCLQISVNQGMTVKMAEGVACIEGYFFESYEDINGKFHTVHLQASHPTLPRIDRIILRLDLRAEARTIKPLALLGTASSNPIPPALTRNGTIYELSLAQVRIDAGVVSILSEKIKDERFYTDLCGIFNSKLGLDPSVWQNQFDTFMASIKTNNTTFAKQWQDKFQENLDFNSELFEEQQGKFKTTFDNWFAEAKINPANYFQMNFDNPSMYLGCTKWVNKLSQTSESEEIRIGTLETGKLVASRKSDKVSSNKIDITYKFYDLTTFKLIKTFTEYVEKVSNTKTKNWVKEGVV